MGRFTCASWLVVVVVFISGCADSSMVLQGRVNQFKQQQLALSHQQQQLQGRATDLDRNNQQLETLLAQSRQQTKLGEDQIRLLREQLRSASAELAESRKAERSSDQKVHALTASLRRRGGVAITPNNSLLRTLPSINLPDVHVRRDGDVIRVELPGGQLFESGSAQLSPGAANLITTAATELLAAYPQQIIGIEGHTDNDPVTGARWRNNHELSVARAIAVYDILLGRTRLKSDQLFVVGHGSNHPVASNATPDGKRRNRRVELVVYPEKKAGNRAAGSG